MRKSDFDEVAKHLRRVFKSPYYFEMSALMLKSPDLFPTLDKIDFVLDRDDCKRAERMRRLFYSKIKPVNERFGECYTLCDKETMPLQAADMLVGFMRQLDEQNPLPHKATAQLSGVPTFKIDLNMTQLAALMSKHRLLTHRFAG
jgi:hypothetical protein